MPVFVLTARRWPLFHNSRYWRSVQGRTYYAKWWSSFPAVEIFAQCKRKQGEIKAWLSIWEQIYTKYVFCKRSHFVEDLQKFLPWNIQTASFFGDWSTPMKKNYGSKLTENNALWWLICTWEIQKVPVKIAYIQHLWRTILSGIFGVVVILFDVTLEKAETWKPGTAHSTGIKYWQVFSKYFNEEKW